MADDFYYWDALQSLQKKDLEDRQRVLSLNPNAFNREPSLKEQRAAANRYYDQQNRAVAMANEQILAKERQKRMDEEELRRMAMKKLRDEEEERQLALAKSRAAMNSMSQ